MQSTPAVSKSLKIKTMEMTIRNLFKKEAYVKPQWSAVHMIFYSYRLYAKITLHSTKSLLGGSNLTKIFIVVACCLSQKMDPSNCDTIWKLQPRLFVLKIVNLAPSLSVDHIYWYYPFRLPNVIDTINCHPSSTSWGKK